MINLFLIESNFNSLHYARCELEDRDHMGRSLHGHWVRTGHMNRVLKDNSGRGELTQECRQIQDLKLSQLRGILFIKM